MIDNMAPLIFTNASPFNELSLPTIPAETRLQDLRELLLEPDGMHCHPSSNNDLAESACGSRSVDER